MKIEKIHERPWKSSVSNNFYFPFHIWDNPSHWRTPSFFRGVETTNQSKDGGIASIPAQGSCEPRAVTAPLAEPKAAWILGGDAAGHLADRNWLPMDFGGLVGSYDIITLWLFNIAMENHHF